MEERTNFIKALAVFAGTIIGVGIFGLPYVASKAGFFVTLFYFLFMSFAAIFVHLLFGEVAAGTKKLHRLPGYAKEYLGPFWEKISFFTLALGLGGAVLAYLIVGGEFLKFLLSPYLGGGGIIYTFFFWGVGSYLILKGIKTISQIELTLLIVFFGIIIIFFIKTLSSIKIENFLTFDPKFIIFPYGVVLFSLWGSALVPEIKEMLKGEIRILRRVILGGIILSAITYLFFIFIVLGVSGLATSKEAISGLQYALGDGIIKLGFIFGVITTFTSFITLGLTLKKMFWYDFGLSPNISWFLACFSPLVLFLIGLREFIDIIGLVGGVMIGIEGIIIIFLYKNFLEQKISKKMNPLIYLFSGVFILGIILESFYFLFIKL